MILTYDTAGIVRCYQNGNIWVPISKQDPKKFWMVGMWDYDILGCSLHKDELEPLVFKRP